MGAIFSFGEDNGPAQGAPSQGSTRTIPVDQCDWKNVDDVATSITDPKAAITAGDASFQKFQFCAFFGAFTSISNVQWAHTAGALGPGLTLAGGVRSTYTTPSTTPDLSLGDMSDLVPVVAGQIQGGQSVLLSTVGPQDPSPSATLAVPGFTQYMVTQLRTARWLQNETTDQIVLSLGYDEQ